MIYQKEITEYKKQLTRAKTVYIKHIFELYQLRFESDKRIPKKHKKLDYETYKFIIKRFFQLLVKRIIDINYVYKLPFGLGYFKMFKEKTGANSVGDKLTWSNYHVDLKKTREMSEKKGERFLVYELEVDYRLYFRWIKGKFTNSTYYYFKTIPAVSKILHTLAVEGKYEKYETYNIPAFRKNKQGETK